MASINVGSSGGSIATVVGVVIFIIAIIILWKRNPNFLSGLFGRAGKAGAVVGVRYPSIVTDYGEFLDSRILGAPP